MTRARRSLRLSIPPLRCGLAVLVIFNPVPERVHWAGRGCMGWRHDRERRPVRPSARTRRPPSNDVHVDARLVLAGYAAAESTRGRRPRPRTGVIFPGRVTPAGPLRQAVLTCVLSVQGEAFGCVVGSDRGKGSGAWGPTAPSLSCWRMITVRRRIRDFRGPRD